MTRRRTAAVLATSLLVALSVAGCSKAENTATGASGDASCQLADAVVEGVRGQADRAVDELTSDPGDAQQRLRTIGDTLEKAEGKARGQGAVQLGRARSAVAALGDQAASSAAGSGIDRTAVVQAQRKLSRAVNAASAIC